MRRLALAVILAGSAFAQEVLPDPSLTLENTIITQLPAAGISAHKQCDAKNNLYIQMQPSGHSGPPPIVRIAADGQSSKVLDLSAVPELPERSSIRDYAVQPDGDYFLLVQAFHQGFLAHFSAAGEFKNKIKIEQLGVDHFAVFKSGEMLLLGVEPPTMEEPDRAKPFNALYSNDGKFLKQIEFETDGEIEAAAKKGELDFQGNGIIAGNTAVSLGAAIAGDDGNVYALRFTSPPTVLVVSPGGVVRTKLTVGDATEIPMGMHVSKGRGYMRLGNRTPPGQNSELVEFDLQTGEISRRYRISREVGAGLACVNESGSVWLGVEKGKIVLRHVTFR